MAITQAMVTSFKVGVLDGTFDFSSGTSQVFKIASVHFSSYARCGLVLAYSVTNEVSGTGYTCGRKHADYLSKPCFKRHYSVFGLCGYYVVYSDYYCSRCFDLLSRRRH
jgi:hypothetical protein